MIPLLQQPLSADETTTFQNDARSRFDATVEAVTVLPDDNDRYLVAFELLAPIGLDKVLDLISAFGIELHTGHYDTSTIYMSGGEIRFTQILPETIRSFPVIP